MGWKVFTVLVLTTIGASSLRAEGNAYQRSKWRTPIYMGFTFNDHEATKVGQSTRGYTGIMFGFGVDYRFLPYFSLSGEMLFVAKAYELNNGSILTRFDPAYLEFPVQLKFQPANWVYFHVGPYLASLVLSGTRQYEGQQDAIKLNFANDYGITGGIWLGIAANPKLNVGLNLRYDYGLADIEFDKMPGDTIKTRTLMPLFTVTFSW